MRAIFVATLLALAMVPALSVPAAAQALAGYGIVLLHGKGRQPGGNIASLASALEAEGAAVVMPKMAWAGAQGRPEKYDVPYEQALTPIKAAVEQLKARTSKVLVAGQSLGANAAIGYAARHGAGIAGVIALAAGHTPERAGFQDRFASEVARAKQLVASGRGGALETFADTNQGNDFRVRATPSAYLSFFDPSGPAIIPHNTKAMPSLPFLWVIGRRDRLAQAGRGYAFDLAPKHAKSRYLEIDADHVGTPTAAGREVIAWLKTL